jgi:molybdate transport repressor ModE-like protein
VEPVFWHGLQLRHLLTLRAVAEEGSFSAAASRLGYTQSGVSAQVRTLERCVGARLVERRRGSRSIALTEQGAVLNRYAIAVLGQLDAARLEI